ncbi:transcriptional regulator PpsR [Lichenicola sp.]|uniref:transcriptional regulator PpsR n=1 Tax=Lichenicola sp. TaxID=2804529 RepID=UPI003B009277
MNKTSEVGRLVGAVADIALLLDDEGLIRDASFRNERLQQDIRGASEWVGRPWTETVAPDSRAKVQALLEVAMSDEAVQVRHLNHLSVAGREIAIQYSTVRMAKGGITAAFGQDLRLFSDLQHKLIDAQEALERDYSALREIQARSRLLFDGAGEALVAVNMATSKIVEFNPASIRMFGTAIRKGRVFADLFRTPSHPKLARFVATLQEAGVASSVTLDLADSGDQISLSGGVLQSEGSLLLLARLSLLQKFDIASVEDLNSRLLAALEQSPDGFVFTDTGGQVLAANAAFLEMVQLQTIDQARGRPLADWLGQGDGGVEADVLIASLRQRGTVRLFSTTLRGQHGMQRQIEISGVIVDGSDQARFGFSIRDLARRLTPPPATGSGARPSSNGHLVELIGRVPLRDLVRDATDVIERLCIEEALKLTGDNRAAAADMLGLSRQSFYVKMRRFGIGNLDDSE